MNDRELLELAAKAAGIKQTCWIGKNHIWFENEGIGFDDENDCQQLWNPLTDDGDALRLAVKLKFNVLIGYGVTRIEDLDGYDPIYHREDAYAATRRAIVCAAAEIGKKMP